LHLRALFLEAGLVRHWGEDLADERRVVKRRVRDDLQRIFQEPLGTDLVDGAVYRSPGTMVALGESIHGNPSTIGVVDDLLGLGIQRSTDRREQRLLGMLAVKVLDGVADGLGRPAQPAGNATADYRK